MGVNMGVGQNVNPGMLQGQGAPVEKKRKRAGNGAKRNRHERPWGGCKRRGRRAGEAAQGPAARESESGRGAGRINHAVLPWLFSFILQPRRFRSSQLSNGIWVSGYERVVSSTCYLSRCGRGGAVRSGGQHYIRFSSSAFSSIVTHYIEYII
ncbi:hypothetical protein B0H13DRAFT_142782 [Mycena leptocephala]|nr:hypothetical protein B0H13DRAFT_142782 [Mycena leptocephala]